MLRTNQKGQGLVEYLVLVCLITISSIAIVSVVGANIKELYANVAHSLQGKKKFDFTEVQRPMIQGRSMDDFTEGAQTSQKKSRSSWLD
ncbi:MAG: Flp family type IVb pilin [Proteobacteria bacterium]|nr:Flp family type IVb pilin [Pseudomonadota bacterium]